MENEPEFMRSLRNYLSMMQGGYIEFAGRYRLGKPGLEASWQKGRIRISGERINGEFINYILSCNGKKHEFLAKCDTWRTGFDDTRRFSRYFLVTHPTSIDGAPADGNTELCISTLESDLED